MPLKLKNITLSGFKSIGKETVIPFNEDVTVFIGANGVGKSSLLSFFQLLNHMRTGNLQNHIADKGGANTFLHFGVEKTKTVDAKIVFADEANEDKYHFNLSYGAGEKLYLMQEAISWQLQGKNKAQKVEIIDAPAKESSINYFLENPDREFSQKKTVRTVAALLRGITYFHLHNTSDTANIKQNSLVENNGFLYHDCGNLAAFLLYLQENKKLYYNRIIKHIQAIMPQFGDFELRPRETDRYCALNWRDKKGNFFAAHQISDGSLRFMALAALLLQPADNIPSIIIIDEPELGLHPVALGYLSSMINTAAQNSQIILATQSSRLLDEFEADNIVVVERDDTEDNSTFRQLSSETLSEWLERYNLSELYDKNILGGKP